jgi:DNA-3-methyladenine glycosylase II
MNKEAIEFLKAKEPRFAGHIERIGLIELKARYPDPFVGLIRSITYQQLATAAAAAIWGRVLALFEEQPPSAARLMAISDEQLRAAGLSRGKTQAMRDIAAKALAGIVPTEHEISQMSEEAIYEQLTQIHGVGPWTVAMLLIFTLNRPDIMPATDLGIRKGIQVLYGKRKLPQVEQIEKFASKWRPHRTTAALYLWRIAEAAKTAKRKAATS